MSRVETIIKGIIKDTFKKFLDLKKIPKTIE